MRRKGRIKNRILKTVTWVAVIVGLYSACAVDSQSWVPVIVCVACLSWIGIFTYANNFFEGWMD